MCQYTQWVRLDHASSSGNSQIKIPHPGQLLEIFGIRNNFSTNFDWKFHLLSLFPLLYLAQNNSGPTTNTWNHLSAHRHFSCTSISTRPHKCCISLIVSVALVRPFRIDSIIRESMWVKWLLSLGPFCENRIYFKMFQFWILISFYMRVPFVYLVHPFISPPLSKMPFSLPCGWYTAYSHAHDWN